MLKRNKLLLLSILYTASIAAFAAPSTPHVVVAPNCLLKNTNVSYKTLSTTASHTLIEVNEVNIEQLANAKHHAKTPCGGFVDVTESYSSTKEQASFLNKFIHPTLKKSEPSYGIQYSAEVNQLIGQINPAAMWGNLTTLSGFQDRYANSDNGVKAANWIKQQVEQIAKENNRTDITAYFVKTGNSYKQPSLVVKLGEGTGPGIVIGGHMDTLNSSWEVKPGADDDGSGIVTVLETARTIISSGMHFKKPIYFIWYAAEEMGLVGSGYVVADFKNKKIPVDAVIQMDMTGFAYENDSTIWLITDHVSKKLTNYLETLITTYVKQPVKRTACGYACSDHASWTQGGFDSSMPAEAAFENTNPVLHTSEDTMDKLSINHMTDYVKLGVAFAVELAEPIK